MSLKMLMDSTSVSKVYREVNSFHYSADTKSLNVKNLTRACKNVSGWRPLGIQLDLNPAQLDDIYQTYHTEGVPTLRIEVFVAWLKNSPDASWTDVVNALRAIDENRVASDIERDYMAIKGT